MVASFLKGYVTKKNYKIFKSNLRSTRGEVSNSVMNFPLRKTLTKNQIFISSVTDLTER